MVGALQIHGVQCLRRVGMVAVVHQQARLGVLHDLLQLGHRQPKVQRQKDRAQTGTSHQRDQLKLVVETEPGHAVTRLHAPSRLQVRGHALHAPPELGEVVGEGAVTGLGGLALIAPEGHGGLRTAVLRQLRKAGREGAGLWGLHHSSFSPGSYRASRPMRSMHSSAVQGNMSEPQRASRYRRSSGRLLSMD